MPQPVAYNGNVTFTVTANAGYTVDQWFENGISKQNGGNSYTTSPVTPNVAVRVTFKLILPVQYTVTPAPL